MGTFTRKHELILSIIFGIVSSMTFVVLKFAVSMNFFLSAGIAAAVLAGLTLVFRPSKRSAKPLKNIEEVRQKLSEARSDFEKLRYYAEIITDNETKLKAERLRNISADIVKYLENNPDKIRLARRFIDYYQKTALSILEKYLDLRNTIVVSDDDFDLSVNTLHALETLCKAFEEQYSQLLNDRIMDMDEEIKILEQEMRLK